MNVRFTSHLTMAAAALVLQCVIAPPASCEEKAENLKVLPGDMPHREVIDVMKGWTRALGVRCDFCHVQKVPGDFDSFDWASDAKEEKLVARSMLQMVQGLNGETLPRATGEQDAAVSCITCHRGLADPATLDQVVLRVVRREGAAAAAARYRELRERYHGAGAYDFGPDSLTPAITQLAQEDTGREAARKLAELTVEMHPEHADSRVVLAQLLLQAGDREGAAAAVAKALELDPQNRYAARLRKQLAE